MIFEYITIIATQIISFFGYFGVFILMMMESMVFPVPSEAVMPFAGFLIAEGKFSFILVLISSSIGSIVGSLISYYMGKFGGRPLLLKYGKLFLLNEHHLNITESFFKKSGEKTIFISRFIPVVRHLISIPAGMAKMNIKKFLIYTALGAAIWNMLLTYLGFKLKENWELIHKYSKELDYIIITVLIIGIIYFIVKRAKHKR